jgi:hypothetical protein
MYRTTESFRRNTPECVLALIAILAVGCGSAPPSAAQTTTTTDSGTIDSGTTDSGTTDEAIGTDGDVTPGDEQIPLPAIDASQEASTSFSPDGGRDAALSMGPPLPFTVDTPNVVRRSNIVLTHPDPSPKDFVGLGNGTLGASVWAANGFTAQLNRADTFPDRKAVGQLVIPGLAKMTTASDFSGYVDLYDATLRESGGGMTATIYIRADAPEMIVDVTGADPSAMQTAKIGLWSGRSPAVAASGNTAVLSETWTDSGGAGSGKTFGILAGLSAGGRNVTASVAGNLMVQVSFQPNADGSFRVVLAAPSWTGGNATSTATSTLGSDTSVAGTALSAGHLGWWHAYWGRIGLVETTSPDGSASYYENLRTLYLYYSAAQNRGTYPGSQAGLADLFDFLQDTQPWYPAGYWVWNLRMQIAANLTSGALDMNIPAFYLYQSNIANLEAWTMARMGGKPGICLPETMRFNGNGTWYNNQGAGSNASCDQAASPSYNALTITSGTEIALWVWQTYLFTQDTAFLTTNYPVMSQAAQFLLAYATQGADGLLHTQANAHETQWNVQDPVTDIAAMQALFPAVISAAGVLGTDASLVSQLQAAMKKIPPLPRTDAATHKQLLFAADDAAGKDVIAISYQPSAAQHNSENLDLEAVWPYSLIGDAGPNTDLARRTYTSRMFVNGGDWSYDAVHAARLGLGGEVASALGRSVQSYQTFVNGLAILFGGANTGVSEPYVEQLGIVATAMNEALVQDYDGLLRLMPALPQGWDAEGTIFIQGNSKVDFQTKGGSLVVAIVHAGSTGSLQVRNPWSGQSAIVLDGSTGTTVVASTSSAMLSVPMTTGHWYAILPSSAMSQVPTVVVTGTPASKPRTLGSVSIGL